MSQATVGGYLLEGEIGRGAAGRVYRGRGPDGARVAVKLLAPTSAGALARFEREAAIQQGLSREEGFVPLLGSGIERGTRYLVMPLLEGGTLRARLARGPLPTAEALRLGVALGEALGRAHARGIVHRDLKPENVLFADRSGPPLVADLGLARFVSTEGGEPSLGLSRTGDLRGTVGYMAPEQMESAKHATPPSDVFALGAIVYECLAGTPAFVGATPLEVIEKIQDGRLVPLERVGHTVPRPLAQVVEQALSREPDARFEDGAAFAKALARAGSASGPSGEPNARGRRGLALALGVVVGGLALVAALAAILWPGSGPTRPEPTTSPRRSTAGSAPTPTPSPRGRRWTREQTVQCLAEIRADRPSAALDAIAAAGSDCPAAAREEVLRAARASALSLGDAYREAQIREKGSFDAGARLVEELARTWVRLARMDRGPGNVLAEGATRFTWNAIFFNAALASAPQPNRARTAVDLVEVQGLLLPGSRDPGAIDNAKLAEAIDDRKLAVPEARLLAERLATAAPWSHAAVRAPADVEDAARRVGEAPDRSRALRSLRSGIALLGPDDRDAAVRIEWRIEGLALEREHSIPMLEAIQDRVPTEGLAHRWLGRIAATDGQLERAREQYAAAGRSLPSFAISADWIRDVVAEGHARIALLLADRGRFDEAEAEVSAVTERKDASVGLAHVLISLRRGRRTEAHALIGDWIARGSDEARKWFEPLDVQARAARTDEDWARLLTRVTADHGRASEGLARTPEPTRSPDASPDRPR